MNKTKKNPNMARKHGDLGKRRLTEKQIKDIRQSYTLDNSVKNRNKLAKHYKVSISMIYRITTHNAYRSVI